MYICGTVRRRVFSIISMRRAGSRSTRILFISFTPLAVSSRSAITQNGQLPVLYIRTTAIYFFFFNRQARFHPGANTTAQRENFAEAVFSEHAANRGGAPVRRRGHNHRAR